MSADFTDFPARPGATAKQQTPGDAKNKYTMKAPKTTTKKVLAKPPSPQRKRQKTRCVSSAEMRLQVPEVPARVFRTLSRAAEGGGSEGDGRRPEGIVT
jgi:hypothetical protein